MTQAAERGTLEESTKSLRKASGPLRFAAALALVFAMLASVFAVGHGVAEGQVDGDDLDPQIHIEIDMFIAGEAYSRGWDMYALGDDRWFDEPGSSYFKVRLAVNEITGEATVLDSSYAELAFVSEYDLDPVPGCYAFDCWTVEDGAEIEYKDPEYLSDEFQPHIESRSVGGQWEVTIESGHGLSDVKTQRFRFTFPKEHVLPALTPRPVEFDARYNAATNLAVDFAGEPLVRKIGGSQWLDWLNDYEFDTDWSDPDEYIDEEAAPDGNGYVPPGGGGGIFNGPGGNSDGGSHGPNNGGWEPGTLADGSWFLDDGSMANYPLEDEVYVPSETIPLECELSDGAIENLDVPIGHVKTARDLIHICEFVEGVDYVIGG